MLLVSMDAARAGQVQSESAERRDLELKCKSERVPVLVPRAGLRRNSDLTPAQQQAAAGKA